ncbi:MAG: flagellar biosynthesis anti-sigma factor FlgM [Gemmataceae bacterium]|nr:flagellar biosynthesis anti-sigma factor FlgM [Gemmataceae bacterium]
MAHRYSNRVRGMMNRISPKSGRPSSAGIRKDLVERVRSEIAAGTYATQEKLEIALDRLAARLSV